MLQDGADQLPLVQPLTPFAPTKRRAGVFEIPFVPTQAERRENRYMEGPRRVTAKRIGIGAFDFIKSQYPSDL